MLAIDFVGESKDVATLDDFYRDENGYAIWLQKGTSKGNFKRENCSRFDQF